MVAVLPLFLLLLSSSLAAGAADDDHEFTVMALSSLWLKPNATCSGHRVTPPHNTGWVPLSRPLGPCSPSSSSSSRAAKARPSLGDLLRQDRLRVADIHRRLSGDFRELKGSKKQPAVVEETQIHHQSALELKLGTEQRDSQGIGPAATDGGSSAGVVQTVVLDTASDVPWVQCVPCAIEPCPTYDPTRSSTYAAVPCNATACRRLGPYGNGCVNGQCQYRIVYPDGSSTSGTYSSDVLAIDDGDAVAAFRFGCSQAEQGSFDPQTSGIMALGRGGASLVSQTAASYGAAFSYCLPPADDIKGFFVLGAPPEAAYRFARTPMLRDRRAPTMYRVLLRAITVAGRPLNVPPEVFAAGSVLDSRTIVTRLPLTAYQALRAAFRGRMAGYRRAEPREELDTCYDLAGVRRVRLPRIALVFDPNVVVELDPSGVLLDGCLAFTYNANDTVQGILGNTQQKTIEVLHDIGGAAVGFRRAAC
ncbi:hypothetical protein ACP4OV_017320 [Aristida adscensionis]